MRIVAFDTETHLIEPGLLAPPLVCVQWQESIFGGKQEAQLRHRASDTEILFEEWLDSDARLVGHNVAYDMGVIAAQWPHLIPKIFAKYDRDQVTDTLLREQLLMIARGTFRRAVGEDGEPHAVKYSLADCIQRHFGRWLKKEGWRMFYRAFTDEADIDEWHEVAREFQAAARYGHWPEWALTIPSDADRKGVLEARIEEYVDYALADATNTLELYESQEEVARRYFPGMRLYADQFRQARAAFALHLSSCWGLYTDPDAVDKLETDLRADFDALQFELQAAGIIRDDGTADTKAAQAAMEQACAEEDGTLFRTKGGVVSMSAEACSQFADDDGEPLPDVGEAACVVANYSRFLTLRKTLTNDIKMLRAGCDVPIQPRYDLADTGRTRASKPPIQAINRGAGIREAFRPRPGKVFIQADFEGLELHTLATWCLDQIGWSKLADALNAGRDVHTDMAATILGITYEDALARVKAKDPVMKEYRQRAKALNFGLPGGLGAKKLVRYAKNSYGATISLAEAETYKSEWLRKFPEVLEFFRSASAKTNNVVKLGDETHIFTGRHRGNVRYAALCNGRFQGLGADAAKEALWRVTKACYVESTSPLYGSRVVAFVHDEIICESDEDKAANAAKELGAQMIEGANVYLGKVPVRLAPQIMRVWSKSAEPVFDAEGNLIPWEPESMKASQKAA